jgi:hypothetical protein
MNAGLTDLSINALAIDPSAPATLYAGTLLGSVFKSMNGGQSWTAVNSGLTGSIVEALVVDSSGPATLYVGTFGGVFKSVDGGGSWTSDERRPDSSTVNALAIDPSTGTLYAGTVGGGVFDYQTVIAVDRPPCSPRTTRERPVSSIRAADAALLVEPAEISRWPRRLQPVARSVLNARVCACGRASR